MNGRSGFDQITLSAGDFTDLFFFSTKTAFEHRRNEKPIKCLLKTLS